jgi:hypothetical protein
MLSVSAAFIAPLKIVVWIGARAGIVSAVVIAARSVASVAHDDFHRLAADRAVRVKRFIGPSMVNRLGAAPIRINGDAAFPLVWPGRLVMFMTRVPCNSIAGREWAVVGELVIDYAHHAPPFMIASIG